MSGALSSRIRERAPRSSLRFILGALEAVAVVATYASHTGWIYSGECTTTWDSGSIGSGRCTACVSLPGKTSGSGCSSPRILCPSTSMEVDESG